MYCERCNGILELTPGLGYLNGSSVSILFGLWVWGHSPSNGFSRQSRGYPEVDAMVSM